MLRKLSRRLSYANVMSTIAVVVAVGTGSAYAANTVFSTDIVDGEVKTADIGDGEIRSADVKDQSLTTFDVSTFLGADVVDGTLTGDDIGDESLTGFDIKDGWIGQVDLADNAVNSAKVANNSLGNGDYLTGSVDSRVLTDDSVTRDDIKDFTLGNGDYLTGSVDSRVATDNSLTSADINESTLDLSPVSTVAFAFSGTATLFSNFTKVASKVVPAGAWAVVATANLTAGTHTTVSGHISDAECQLRNPSNGVIGGTADRRQLPVDDSVRRSLSMNGGALVPAGGGEISLWCNTNWDDRLDNAQVMMTRVGGFS